MGEGEEVFRDRKGKTLTHAHTVIVYLCAAKVSIFVTYKKFPEVLGKVLMYVSPKHYSWDAPTLTRGTKWNDHWTWSNLAVWEEPGLPQAFHSRQARIKEAQEVRPNQDWWRG